MNCLVVRLLADIEKLCSRFSAFCLLISAFPPTHSPQGDGNSVGLTMNEEDNVRIYWIPPKAMAKTKTIGSAKPEPPPSSYIY